MKTQRYIIIYVLSCLASLLPACSVNNGDIGIYYGTWAMESYTIDGIAPDDVDPESWLWSFQNSVVCIEHNLGQYNDHTLSFGTWSESDDGKTLILNFTHSDNTQPPGTGTYAAPVAIGFEPNSTAQFDIASATGKTIKLTRIDSQGHRLDYTLRKTW